MSEYELLYIISPRVPADDVQNAVERVSALITAQGGEVLSIDNWGRRRLAYPIRQYFEGTYVLATMELPPAGAVGLEKALNLAEEVIRHLLISGIIPRTGGRPRDERDQYSDAPTMAPAMDTDAGAPMASEAEPEAAESAAAEPAAVEPVAAEPTVAESVPAEPATAE